MTTPPESLNPLSIIPARTHGGLVSPEYILSEVEGSGERCLSAPSLSCTL